MVGRFTKWDQPLGRAAGDDEQLLRVLDSNTDSCHYSGLGLCPFLCLQSRILPSLSANISLPVGPT